MHDRVLRANHGQQRPEKGARKPRWTRRPSRPASGACRVHQTPRGQRTNGHKARGRRPNNAQKGPTRAGRPGGRPSRQGPLGDQKSGSHHPILIIPTSHAWCVPPPQRPFLSAGGVGAGFDKDVNNRAAPSRTPCPTEWPAPGHQTQVWPEPGHGPTAGEAPSRRPAYPQQGGEGLWSSLSNTPPLLWKKP